MKRGGKNEAGTVGKRQPPFPAAIHSKLSCQHVPLQSYIKCKVYCSVTLQIKHLKINA